ncbi:MAG TPA: PQQ-binding-like beta-propeller repeat protein [Solirubrobacterales bacterium]|nr:PQQ-binding-like beta-propeller repeat protein [Solirubrobacterales bacterium]
MTFGKLSWKAGIAMLLLAAALLVGGCGSSDDSTADENLKLTGDAWPGVDLAGTRSVDSPINGKNVKDLEEVWRLPLKAQSSFGAMASTPVIANGAVYLQDLESNVQVVSLESGEVQWTYKANEPTLGPNGVVVADGMVFGATSSEAFALDQETGKELWKTPLSDGPDSGIDMAPGYHDGLVYVSTVPTNPTAQYPAGIVGTLYALDAETGKVKWEWESVPKDLWGDPKTNSGGGLWYPPSFDGKGFMYFGTGNPAPFPGTPKDPWGSSRPGPNLYTNSLVKMNAKTGKMEWYYQQTPHDIYDWDFQNTPILTKIDGRDVAIGSGKSGYVVAADAKTGNVIWKKPLGIHNGHDQDPLYAMRGEYEKLKTEEEVLPGYLGGIIAPIAANETAVFVPVVNHAGGVSKSQERIEGQENFGIMVSIDKKTGQVNWYESYEEAPFGAPTVTNDLVFFVTSGGILRALDIATGELKWEQKLPAGANSGVAISGDTVVAPAGLPSPTGENPSVVAYRLPGQ